jgi:hypothetical protein
LPHCDPTSGPLHLPFHQSGTLFFHLPTSLSLFLLGALLKSHPC